MIIFLPRLKQKEYDKFGDEVDVKSPSKETFGGGKKPKVDRMAEKLVRSEQKAGYLMG